MRHVCALLVALGTQLSPELLSGQEKRPPPVVLAGIDAYRKQGPEAAVKEWLANSRVARDTALVLETIAGLKRVEEAYGVLEGYDVIKLAPIGSRNLRTYLILLYRKGALFLYFDTYREASGWIVTGFQYNTKPDGILPASVLDPP